VKALSLTQPWAQLVADGRKHIETRSWSTNYVGDLAIHAAKKIDADACRAFGYDPKTVTRGGVVAMCSLLGCRRITERLMAGQSDEELSYGNFEEGRYAWILGELHPAIVPIPARGSLGLWEWTR
jgi:hypothetical protein